MKQVIMLQTKLDAAVADEEELPSNYRWIGPEQMKELAFPNVFLKLLNDYWENSH